MIGVAREPNQRLRAVRERTPSRRVPGAPMSRTELADSVNAFLWERTGRRYALDDHAIGKWERGAVRCPIPEYRAALRVILGADDAGLGFPPARDTVTTATTTVSGVDSESSPLDFMPSRIDATSDADQPRATTVSDTEDMDRRDLLRLFTMSGAALALPAVDTDRILSGHTVDATMLDDYARLNAHLWQVFALSTQKRTLLPLVREQLGVLSRQLNRAPGQHRERVCVLVANLYQLAGETLFDGDHYTDAAHSYVLAAQAAREAQHHDLWATALTRHSFIESHTSNHANALPILDLAEAIAKRGNPAKATRFWVAAVRAETHAGLGDPHRCETDLDAAAHVAHLDPNTATETGWLRFDGTRLPEQHGTIAITLGRLDVAETALTTSLGQAHKSARRRAVVHADLATVAARRRDPNTVVAHLREAITAAHATESRYIVRKLDSTKRELQPLANYPQVRAVHQEITNLGRALTNH